MTQRICFQLRINPDLADEYKERHANVWPEMLSALSETGWKNYSLFLAPDGVLTGYLECEDFALSVQRMGETAINEKWQASMAKFFVGLDGVAPDGAMAPLEEVFHLD